MITAVLAAGDFPPPGSRARRILDAADKVVCCDGAADAYRSETGREPDAVVGDLDSLKGNFRNTVRIPEQESNDLEKAVGYARGRGWSGITILGATGGREDHSIGNLFRALDLGVRVATVDGEFFPVCGHIAFGTEKGAAISVFAPDPATTASSQGLEWPLDGVPLRNLYCATLNRATASRVEISSSRPILVYNSAPRDYATNL